MTKNRVRRACVLLVLLLAATLQLHAQTLPSSITPEQLQIFQSLSPEQQQAVLSALKGNGAAGALGASPANQLPSSAAQGLQGAPGMQGPQPNAAMQQLPPGPPRLQPNSVLLLTVISAGEPCDQATLAAEQGAGSSLSTPGQPGSVTPPATLPTGACTPATGETRGASGPTSAPPLPISEAVAERLLGAQGGLVGGQPITSPDVQEKLRTLLEDRRQQILDGNPYTLNSIGQLTLPTFPPITLWGLTEDEATALLNAEPDLAGLTFKVSLLPVVNVATTALQPFGYDLFSSQQSGFAPPGNIPVPTSYIVGPGDTVDLELYGKQQGDYSLAVDRNGYIHIPGLGPLQVAGLKYDQVKQRIQHEISTQMIGVESSVTMGVLRTIQVFVTGDVNIPSSYQVSSLSTVTNALYVAGGVSKIGSLRNVEVKRDGRVIAKLDVYALLLHGNSSGDVRLQQGDVVFVPPVGPTVSIGGEVRRPAIYEVRSGDTIGDVLSLAGGLVPDADPHAAKLERVDGGADLKVVDLDLTSSSQLAMRLHAGDILTVPHILDEMADSVSLEGEALRPGMYAWHAGMHLTNLLTSLAALKEDADQRYVLIRRESYPGRRVSVLSADAVRAFQAPGTSADPLLQSRDRVIVLPLKADRGDDLAEVLQQLKSQTRDGAAPPIVTIDGQTIAPGTYPLQPGMRISDLVRAGGGLDSAAYRLDAELTRYVVAGGQYRKTEIIPVDLAAALQGNDAADVSLEPYDTLIIKELPYWATQGSVTIAGQVRFPGTYPITEGETLSSLIKRAGGLTPYAFPDGAVFTRVAIQEEEQKQMDELAVRMQSQLTTVALQSTQTQEGQNAGQALTIGENLLAQLKSARAVGRLVISLQDAINHPGQGADIELRPGDQLLIPRARQYVTVIGEVQNPTAHIWKTGLTRDDYIEMSGGPTRRADKGEIYVVRADGSVVLKSGSRWFSRSPGIQAGDTIVVPLNAEHVPALTMWKEVTTILYNIAVAVAAVHAL
ncbi:MAG TPA: SLBB domain-containing protein [Steroidobacteraceae bacterium]|nr:SLBB domain-containing protein [Steroidobacteraceae bacterium]